MTTELETAREALLDLMRATLRLKQLCETAEGAKAAEAAAELLAADPEQPTEMRDACRAYGRGVAHERAGLSPREIALRELDYQEGTS